MKRIMSLMLAVALVFALAIPAMAAGNLNSYEEKLLSEFTAVVNQYKDLDKTGELASNYIASAQSALAQDGVDLDEAAYKDLSACIADVSATIKAANPQTGADLKALSSSIVSKVNAVAGKYGFTVSASVDSATVKVDGTKVGTTGSIVNQTGFDMTATYAVIAVVAVVLAAAFVAVRKEKLVSRV